MTISFKYIVMYGKIINDINRKSYIGYWFYQAIFCSSVYVEQHGREKTINKKHALQNRTKRTHGWLKQPTNIRDNKR